MKQVHSAHERRETVGQDARLSPSTSAVRDFGQLALWMAATLAGMVTGVLVARAPHFRRMQRSVGVAAPKGKRRQFARPTKTESLPLLAGAIVGTSRNTVAAVFGPPRAAVVNGAIEPGSAGSSMWQAQTWYYPLQQEQSLAMAIEFVDDSARHVEFFQAPGVAVAA